MARSQFDLRLGAAPSPEQSKHHGPPNRRRPKKLLAVLSGEEVNRLLSCVKCHKHRTFLVLQYACGLRLNEAAHLKISDIDSQRMQIRVDCGKGQKTRVVPMAPRLLAALREYWIAYRPEVYLFPGRTPDIPLNPTTIQKMFKVAAKDVLWGSGPEGWHILCRGREAPDCDR